MTIRNLTILFLLGGIACPLLSKRTSDKKPIDSWYKKGYDFTRTFSDHLLSAAINTNLPVPHLYSQLVNDIAPLTTILVTQPETSSAHKTAFRQAQSFTKGLLAGFQQYNSDRYFQARNITLSRENKAFLKNLQKLCINALNIIIKAKNVADLKVRLNSLRINSGASFLYSVSLPSFKAPSSKISIGCFQ